ncbi:hypothetical protein IEO21_08024 [Rhodonia placenta]|uniref:NmrA-like domain-containing protein n=1 Tax=Rhodonia placenta TaxID=104341 RepID=A0A8H7TZT0_9APHY|nr:hypothetical protein IEO21_08024 [Postia placenta]
MTSPSYKPLVLIVGATGRTGGVIIDALIKCAKFRTVALIRPSSAAKPEVEQLRARGVEIRLGDITDTEDKHKAVLSGIDVLISAVHSEHLTAQKPLISAARDVGVKRVIPCDFAMPGAKGVQDMLDEKLAIRDFVRALGVGYTFVDVGWWMQLALPFPTSSDKKNLYTNMEHIGTYVARIIDDDRTLNQYVIIWEDELTLEEVKTIAEKASGEEDVLRAKRVVVEADELQSRAKVAKEEALRNPNPGTQILRHGNQFMISMHILGENSLENAKALGALDVRELYPDIVPQKLGDFAQTFYQAPSLPNVQ